ncbi:MAG: HNH endonuclease [Butyrivibrio sp.]|jgi:Zn finger protein HypA/HybF involved in hydrogenase expression|nr:HNH endonuclease [Butyrivibrio sp.]
MLSGYDINSKYFEESDEHINEVLALTRKFAGDFNLSVMRTLPIEKYAMGNGSHDNFCYRIERELLEMGDIRGISGVQKYGVWFDKNNGKYVATNKFGSDPDEAWGNVRKEISNLIKAGENEDYTAIKKNNLAPLFKFKILAVYYPEKYLTLYSDNHLSYFCKRAGIPLNNDDDTIKMQDKLLKWKDADETMSGWSIIRFSRFLYHHFGYPPKDVPEWKPKHNDLLKKAYADLKDFENKYPDAKVVEILKRERSAKIAAVVKARAHGICQLCGKPAPFYSKNGDPYLECHHIIWIADGGADELDNAVALCPNCHRKMHILNNEKDIEYLKIQISKK